MGVSYRIKRLLSKSFSRFKKQTPVYIPILQSELLKDRVALITGGTSGIGYSIAKAFLESGAFVIITGRDISRVDKCCSDLRKLSLSYKDKVLGIDIDQSNIALIENRLSNISDILGSKKIDILVNNAGIIKGANFGKTEVSDFDLTIETNLKGVYFMSQFIANLMKENNIKGNILNIASSSSNRPAISPYMLSKWGIKGLTLGLAKLLISDGIIVNGLAPGPTYTPMLINDNNNTIDLSSNPLGRYATPEEIANMAVILVSDLGRLIVGDIIYMSGGAGMITVDDIKY